MKRLKEFHPSESVKEGKINVNDIRREKVLPMEDNKVKELIESEKVLDEIKAQDLSTLKMKLRKTKGNSSE